MARACLYFFHIYIYTYTDAVDNGPADFIGLRMLMRFVCG